MGMHGTNDHIGTGLLLENVGDVQDLIDELDRQFNKNQIHLLVDDDSIDYEDVTGAAFNDVRHPTYDSRERPTEWEFVVEKEDGSNRRGHVNIQWSGFRPSRAKIEFPKGTRYAVWQFNFSTNEPWKLESTELEFATGND